MQPEARGISHMLLDMDMGGGGGGGGCRGGSSPLGCRFKLKYTVGPKFQCFTKLQVNSETYWTGLQIF